MTCHEAHTLYSFYSTYCMQEIGKFLLGGQVSAPGINVLAQERNFAVARTRQLLYFSNDRLAWPTLFCNKYIAWTENQRSRVLELSRISATHWYLIES